MENTVATPPLLAHMPPAFNTCMGRILRMHVPQSAKYASTGKALPEMRHVSIKKRLTIVRVVTEYMDHEP